MPRVAAKDLAKVLRADDRARRTGVKQGLRKAAVRGLAVLKDRARHAGKVDQGQFVGSGRTVENGQGLLDALFDAPHAGIVEVGARPHKVSREGFLAIYEWVRRHRKELGFVTAKGRARSMRAVPIPKKGAGLNPELEQVTWAIVKKIEREGQKGTFIVRDALPKLSHIARAEVESAVRARIGRGARR